MWPFWLWFLPQKKDLDPFEEMLFSRNQFDERIASLTKKDRLALITGNCEIREHTRDGASVGRCTFALYDNICPRHGLIEMYPNLDDREVDPQERIFIR
jgi:hypothetical protein